MPVTRDDVARRAGVSAATVSYVINDGPRPVSPETRAKVLRAIEELGYRPSAVARSLRLQRTSTIGLLVPDTSNSYFAELAQGIEQVAFSNGYTVILCHTCYDPQKELEYVDVLYSKRVDGVIFIPATSSLDPIQQLMDRKVPVVVVDRLVSGTRTRSVVVDNFRGGYEATAHLINLGHKRIGCIIRPIYLAHSMDRVRGYKAALRDHGLPVDESCIVKGGFRYADGDRAMQALLALDPPPTAVFAYNDIMAIGAMRAIHTAGLRVPQDVSVVGFDDIDEASYTNPPLTTVAQPKLEMGRKGAELLIEMMQNADSPSDATLTLDVHLVVRQSTGPVPH
ncbi:MAG: LacI family DNA-binding transcriptional regulator [Anaerolineae bacterium]